MEVVSPKKRGRPAKGRDPLVTVRLTPEMLERIARWRMGYPKLTASETLRVLIDLGLKTPPSKRFSVSDPKAMEKWSIAHQAVKLPTHAVERCAPPVKPPPLVEPEPYRPRRQGRSMTKADIEAAVVRAEAVRQGR